ncbi:PREDICTED: glomulin isoform X2 [Vollenhovia emeryi]|nr:PREDICTED: glomulin isoform X2 [Vollenhovia emeryi]
MNQTSQILVNQVTDFLDEANVEGAMWLLMENQKDAENSLNGIMSAIVSNLTGSVSQHKQPVFQSSFEVLTFILKTHDPAVTVLELQKYVRCASDHVNFCAILDALQYCLTRIPNKGRVIDWCLDSLKIYVENLPLPDDVDDDLKEASDRIVDTHKVITTFLKPLVQEAIVIESKQKKRSVLGGCLLAFFIFLCGKPFCCLNKYISEETVYEELANDMVSQTLCLTGDILYFLDTVGQRKRYSSCVKGRLEKYISDHIFDWNHNVPDVAYANFYFYVFTKENYWTQVPQVYNPCYILEACAYFFKILLSEDYSIPNGLIFMENVIRRIPSHSVDSKVLKLDIYTELFQPITKVMIYSNNDEQRKMAVRVFQEYIEIFDIKARYTVILYLYEIVEHSSLLSFIAGLCKSYIAECLDSTPRNPQFLGKNMKLLLKKVCNLPHGSSSDIVEISDEIITALNLLRYLFIRDTNDETGIWDMTDVLKNDYLNPLREGIDSSKAYWRVKMKDLEQQKKDLAREQDCSKLMQANADMEVTLTIGGEQLPIMPLSPKMSICSQVLNGLDVMESILIRVNECISMNGKLVKKSDECSK